MTGSLTIRSNRSALNVFVDYKGIEETGELRIRLRIPDRASVTLNPDQIAELRDHLDSLLRGPIE